MKSKITLFFTILICFLLQSTVISRIAIGSITPNLILILCISMGLMRGRKSGMWTGFFCGFLVDMFYGSVFGFYALIYMYIGFLSGYAHRICYDDDVKVRGRLGLGTYLSRIILPETFYTIILTLIVYRVFYYINYHLMSPLKKESESIWVLK